jgi:hypothetical protein
MTNPDLCILGFEVALSDDSYDASWTETKTHSHLSAVSSLAEEGVRPPKMITVQVKDVIDALAGRSIAQPLWLKDFHEDPISITEDMFEVLVVYQAMRRAA